MMFWKELLYLIIYNFYFDAMLAVFVLSIILLSSGGKKEHPIASTLSKMMPVLMVLFAIWILVYSLFLGSPKSIGAYKGPDFMHIYASWDNQDSDDNKASSSSKTSQSSKKDSSSKSSSSENTSSSSSSSSEDDSPLSADTAKNAVLVAFPSQNKGASTSDFKVLSSSGNTVKVAATSVGANEAIYYYVTHNGSQVTVTVDVQGAAGSNGDFTLHEGSASYYKENGFDKNNRTVDLKLK